MKLFKKLKTYYSDLKNRNKAFKGKDRIDAGFTFVETMAVLAVTALLAAQSGVAVHKIVDRAKVSAAKTQIETIKVALQSYYVDCGGFPTEEQGLSSLWEKPTLYPVPENWNGPYLDKKIPKDPWGTEYGYFPKDSAMMPRESPEGIPYAIVCFGKDKTYGGENDIVSWEEF